ncbi:uncharacterized protein LOC127094165 [Lathyrus oleraceus]|uniref:uncharacterized protein LOC127094165 n=1 Tax=Pisum sativum TaxID=3888 RepID=UPI0021CFFF9A|nr:uncharacterized protein LOC127094165 [Pisum sativum]
MYQNSGKATEMVTTDGHPEKQKDNREEDKNEEAVEKEKPYLLKEILSNKKKLEDSEIVTLTAECSAIIQNNMPHKLKDLGMLENVLVRIDQFYIPAEFIIMDIKEDFNIPIILGRPFLATTGAIIDVKKGKPTFEVGEEKVEFILSQFLKASTLEDSCYFLDVIDE